MKKTTDASLWDVCMVYYAVIPWARVRSKTQRRVRALIQQEIGRRPMIELCDHCKERWQPMGLDRMKIVPVEEPEDEV